MAPLFRITIALLWVFASLITSAPIMQLATIRALEQPEGPPHATREVLGGPTRATRREEFGGSTGATRREELGGPTGATRRSGPAGAARREELGGPTGAIRRDI